MSCGENLINIAVFLSEMSDVPKTLVPNCMSYPSAVSWSAGVAITPLSSQEE